MFNRAFYKGGFGMDKDKLILEKQVDIVGGNLQTNAEIFLEIYHIIY